MSYLKINGYDFSHCVNKLEITRNSNYIIQTNAAGNSVVDYINAKRAITVGIIPLTHEDMCNLQSTLYEISSIEVYLEFLNPETNEMDSANCILPSNAVSYYTIQTGKVLFNTFTLTFTEL